MQTFFCTCGQRIFFENSHCTQCGLTLGFVFANLQFHSLKKTDDALQCVTTQKFYKPCQNQTDFGICNWLIDKESPDYYCEACALNKMVPAVTAPEKRDWWHNMEKAKKRLLFTIGRLKLPIENGRFSANGLNFAFLEDHRTNPDFGGVLIKTGHQDGLITVNLAEADDLHRESTRVEVGELYRTLLGHFRHESGHYYFDRLIKDTPLIDEFREYFGDDTQDYAAALKRYYDAGSVAPMDSGFISNYASSHPLEDWAECWAHYLHMVDTLGTAAAFGMSSCDPFHSHISDWLPEWDRVSVMLNELNRSMGLRDAYPFVLSAQSVRKLHFVHRVIYPT